jgi:hypothetical protein
MPQNELSAYLVEIEPQIDTGEAGSIAARARGSANGVRFLRSIYVPEDDRWFLLYEGASAAEVAAAAERAEANVVSIAGARDLPRDGHDRQTRNEIPEVTDVSASTRREACRQEGASDSDSEKQRRGR